ncbi:MAG: exonuclease SbcCD subunit D [Christensenellaceae bacterium]|jgi:exonuclease SbcD|nr:exonuclease SbcCD subunit D [Christensenellaceae bacterium]
MKFFHISDLHIGKRINEFSMFEDQQYILEQIVKIAIELRPDAVLIAGDVYDKNVPSEDAILLLDKFLCDLNDLDIAVYVIAGNHDSQVRLAFGAKLLKSNNVHIVGSFSGIIEKSIFSDQYGEIGIWMLPYLKPSLVRKYFENEEITNHEDAIATVLKNTEIDKNERNILIAHQFVTNADISGSEEIYVGTLEDVSAALFSNFDYVALGHIHRAQSIGCNTVRYSGTPLKYSIHEADQIKSITVVEMLEKGNVKVSSVLLEPLREVRKIRGKFDEILEIARSDDDKARDDYIYVVLTDEQDVPNATNAIRSIYPNLAKIEYDNTRTRSSKVGLAARDLQNRDPVKIFAEFFKMQNGRDPGAEQLEYVETIFKRIASGECEYETR